MTCRNRNHRPQWYVQVRKANYSAFNGGHRTPSAYSAIRCAECGGCWRTKAKYVDTLPDQPPAKEAVPCPCFYFEMDPDLTGNDVNQVCACGHIDDEHDEQGECLAVIQQGADL